MGLRTWVYDKTGIQLKNMNIEEQPDIIPYTKIESAPACPVCDSKYTIYYQDVYGQRTQQKHSQRFCMECQSFFHKSNYRESNEQQKADFEFLMGYKDTHQLLMELLARELKTKLPGTRTMLEIGFGTGYFLKACQKFGMQVNGFEVNKYCYDYAKHTLKLKCTHGIFDHTHEHKYDLITAIQVFEHLENPRELFKTMQNHLNPSGAIYLSVPFVEKEQWKFLWNAGEPHAYSVEDVFNDNDVHITHFSIEGMKKMGMSMGARSAEYFLSKDTDYASPGAYQGVLFRF